MDRTRTHQPKRTRSARSLGVLLAAATWLGVGPLAATSRADNHSVDFKIKNVSALTDTALPIFVDYDCYGRSRAAVAEAVEQLLGPILSDEQVEDAIEESCHTRVIEQPLMDGAQPWGGRFYGRDWSATIRTELYVPVDKDTLSASFGSAGRVNTDFDLDDAEAEVTIELKGERVSGIASVLHPFNQTITYSATAIVGGLHGSVDVSLAVDGDTVEVAQIHPDSIDLGFDEDGVDFEFETNNLLVSGIAEVLDVVVDVGMGVYGIASGDCRNTESCLLAIFDKIVIQNESFMGLDSPDLLESLTDSLNGALSTPIALSQQIETGGFSADVDVALSALTTSASRNDMTASFTIGLDSQNASSCATGLTGHTAPAAGTPSSNPADLQLTVPYSLIGDAAKNTLKQLDYCKTYNLGGPTVRVQPNGAIAISRIGSSLALTLPLKAVSTASGATGSFTFSARVTAQPSLDDHANIVLDPAPPSMLNLAGTITIPGATTIDIVTGKVTKGPATVYTGVNFATPIQNAVNGLLAGFDLPTFVQFASPYFIPHAYLKPGKINIDSGSFTFGMNVKDGTQEADLAVVRIEAAGAPVDRTVGGTKYRDVPLLAIVKNKLDRVAPPVDLTITAGSASEVLWLPELAALEEYAVPYQVTVRLNANGTVASALPVNFWVDKQATTIFDENRSNDAREITINNDWFRPDYRVEIVDVTSRLMDFTPVGGSSSGTDPIDSIHLTVTALVRNIGSGALSQYSLSQLRTYVNDDAYDYVYVGSIASGGEQEVVFEIDVDDGPDPYYCTYRVEVEVNAADDRAPANDDAFATLEVSHDACHGSPSIESFDPGEFEMKDLGNGDQYENTHGNQGWESNFPILDELPPL